MMNDDDEKNQLLTRIDALEMRISFLDDLLETLNKIVTQQSHDINIQAAQLKIIYAQLSQQQRDSGIENFDPTLDIPPHY